MKKVSQTDGQTDGRTDGRTEPFIEPLVAAKNICTLRLQHSNRESPVASKWANLRETTGGILIIYIIDNYYILKTTNISLTSVAKINEEIYKSTNPWNVSGRDIFCLKNFDTYPRTPVRVSKMNVNFTSKIFFCMIQTDWHLRGITTIIPKVMKYRYTLYVLPCSFQHIWSASEELCARLPNGLMP